MQKKRTGKSAMSDDALLIALACGATVETASAKSGLSQRTVYRRLEDGTFRKKLQSYRNDLVARATSMLTAAMMEAVKTMLNLMGSSHGAAARLGAARSILELGLKLRQATELEERMALIEERLQRQDETKSIR